MRQKEGIVQFSTRVGEEVLKQQKMIEKCTTRDKHQINIWWEQLVLFSGISVN